jgi:hypothetical protein
VRILVSFPSRVEVEAPERLQLESLTMLLPRIT